MKVKINNVCLTKIVSKAKAAIPGRMVHNNNTKNNNNR